MHKKFFLEQNSFPSSITRFWINFSIQSSITFFLKDRFGVFFCFFVFFKYLFSVCLFVCLLGFFGGFFFLGGGGVFYFYFLRGGGHIQQTFNRSIYIQNAQVCLYICTHLRNYLECFLCTNISSNLLKL